MLSFVDADSAAIQCQVYNDWLSDHVQEGGGRLFGVAVVPQQDRRVYARRHRELPTLRYRPHCLGIGLPARGRRVTDALMSTLATLDPKQSEAIAGTNADTLYGPGD